MKQLQLSKMKKLLLIIPIFILSCTKDVVSKTSVNQDSLKAADQLVVENPIESLDQGIVALPDNPKPKEISKTFRVISGDSIIKTINADMIPLTISEEFTSSNQKYFLKIKNFTAKKISGNIKPDNMAMNIRFSQIKLPNGNFDGPFTQDISYEVKEKGEIWLIIGKSNMASGEAKGKFKVTIK